VTRRQVLVGFAGLVATSLLLPLVPAFNANALAQQSPWKTYLDAGVESMQHGRYAEAEHFLRAAMREAVKQKDREPRAVYLVFIALTMNLVAQRKYADAEPLFRQMVANAELLSGREHPDVATALRAHAWILKQLNRDGEAKVQEERAAAIDAIHRRAPQ